VRFDWRIPLRKLLFFPVVLFFSIRGNLRYTLLAAIGMLVALIFHIVFGAISQTLDTTIRTRLIGDLPINTLHVYRKIPKQDLGILFGKKKFDGIKSQQLGIIKNMEGVKAVLPVQYLHRRASMAYKLPSLKPSLLGGLGDLFSGKKSKLSGKHLMFDTVIAGVPRGLVYSGLRSHKAFRAYKKTNPEDQSETEVVPLLVPQAYLDLMSTYMTVNGIPNSALPSLSSPNWPETDLKIKIGYSVGLKQKDDEIVDYHGKLAGILSGNRILAFAAPLAWVRKQNREVYPESVHFYREAFVEVDSSTVVDSVSKSIRKLGLKVSSAGPVARKAGRTMELVKQFLNGMSWVIIAIAMTSVFNAFLLIVTRRRHEVSLLRFLGAGRMYMIALLVWEAFLLSQLTAWLAVTASQLLLQQLNESIQDLLPAAFHSLIPAITLPDSMDIYVHSALACIMAVLLPAFWAAGNRILGSIKK
jgi:ABC-type antimicrobial peptide transport system permease subunit